MFKEEKLYYDRWQTLNNCIVSGMEKKYESNGLLLIAFHELDLILIGAN